MKAEPLYKINKNNGMSTFFNALMPFFVFLLYIPRSKKSECKA